MTQRLLRKLGHLLLTFLVFVYIVFEELVWETIAKPIYTYLHSLKILQKAEHFIANMNRYLLLGLFLILFVQVELLGVAAVALLAKGQVFGSIFLYASKIPIGAITFWLFRISKEKLMRFDWFKWLYEMLMQLIDKIKASETYHHIKEKTASLRAYMKTKITVFKATYFKDRSVIAAKIKYIYTTIKKLFQKG